MRNTQNISVSAVRVKNVSRRDLSRDKDDDSIEVYQANSHARSATTESINQSNSSLSPNTWNNDSLKENLPKPYQKYEFNIFSSMKGTRISRLKVPHIQSVDIMSSKRVIYVNENDQNLTMKKRRKRQNTCHRSAPCIILLLIIILIIIAIIIGISTTLTRNHSTTSSIETSTITQTTTTTLTTTTETTTTPYMCGNMTVLLDTDILGFDISNSGGSTWISCCILCLYNSLCRSFTLNIPISACYLKTTPTNNGTFSATHISAKY